MRAVLPFSIVLAVLVLAPASAAQDWSMGGGNAARTGEATSEPSAAPGVTWSHALGGPLAAEAVVSSGALFAIAGGASPYLRSLNASDGGLRWGLPLSDLVAPPWTPRGDPPAPAVAGTALFVLFTGRNGTSAEHREILVALNASDGSELWRYEGATYPSGTDPGIRSSPLLVRDRVLFGSGDGTVRALGAGSGAPIWEEGLGSPVKAPASFLETGSPLVGDLVLAGDDLGNLHALDFDGQADGDDGIPDAGDPGDVIWTTDVGAPLVHPAIGTPTAVYAAAGSALFSLSPVWGSVAWSEALPAAVAGPLLLRGTTLVVGGADDRTRGLDPGDGAYLWVRQTGTLRPWRIASPTRVFGAAAFDATRDTLFALDPADGSTVWSAVFPGPIVHGSIGDGTLFAGTGEPAVTAFGPSPDLAVRTSDILLTPSPAQEVFRARVEASVNNVGDLNVSRSFWIAVVEVVGVSRTELANATVPYLEPGRAASVVVPSWDFTPGLHRIEVVVERVPGERSAANNVASVSFYAAAGPPQVIYQWSPAFGIALGAIAALGVLAGWVIALVGRRRERDVEMAARERRAER